MDYIEKIVNIIDFIRLIDFALLILIVIKTRLMWDMAADLKKEARNMFRNSLNSFRIDF